MKKIISLLTSCLIIPSISYDTTSCWLFNKKNKPNSSEIADMINNKINIILYGNNSKWTSDKLNANDDSAKKSILDNIGLTEKEQEKVTLTGTLTKESKSPIIFEIKNYSKTIDKDVGWYTKPNDDSDIQKSKNNVTAVIDGILFLGSGVGLYKFDSSDNKFKPVIDIISRTDPILAIYNEGTFIYVSSKKELYKSTDGLKGEKYETIPAFHNKIVVSIFKTNHNVLEIGTAFSDGWFYSTDAVNYIKVETSLFPSNYWVQNFCELDDRLFIGMDHSHLFSANEEGTDIKECTVLNGSTDTLILSLFVKDKNVFVGTKDCGLLKNSDSSDLDFQKVDTKIPSESVYDMELLSNGEYFISTGEYLYFTRDFVNFTKEYEGKDLFFTKGSELDNIIFFVMSTHFLPENTGVTYYNLN